MFLKIKSKVKSKKKKVGGWEETKETQEEIEEKGGVAYPGATGTTRRGGGKTKEDV
jgi:hypothetical protein